MVSLATDERPRASNVPTLDYDGLSSTEAARRLAQYGPNEIVRAKKLSAAEDLFRKFKNPLVLILIFAAGLSFFLGDRVSSVIILLIVLSSAMLDFFNTHKSQHAAEALRRRVLVTATVVRDGVDGEVPFSLVVPGDVVLLTPGDLIPADGTVASSEDFFVSESALTGESFPVEKRSGAQVFLGTSAVSGSAVMRVTATGRKTSFSKIADNLVRAEEPTEFDRNLREFSFFIANITFLLVLFVFFVNALSKHSLLESFLFAVALAVGLTPELLPMIVALNLSKGSLAMAKRGVIVKKLSAIQDFGSIDVLCTDKTGTLTEDKIRLVRYMGAAGEPSEDVLYYSYLSSTYQSGIANPLDAAVREYTLKDISDWKKIDELPFDFTRRRDSIAVVRGQRRILITKGAPEEIFRICRFFETSGQRFDEAKSVAAKEVYQKLSREGYRVLGIARKELAEIRDTYTVRDECDMTFIGFIAFLDPPKETVRETLRLLSRYGIEVKIITGDNELVSEKIAHDLSLVVKGVLLGADMDALTEEALRVRVEETTLFARVSPIQKLRLIRCLRRNGHVVGYLGDGINDAPALKAADVGLSVNNAVDVAKESADLILLNKSLATLVDGVLEGRRIFSNTMKYLMMGLSSNFGNMFSMAGASLFLPFLPMLPTQILFNNLLYDGSQFVIPLDRVDPEDIEKPRRLSTRFLRRFMFVFGPLSSLFDFLTFGLLLSVFRFGAASFQTGWFLESLATQTIVVYAIRSRHLSFFKSKPHQALVISTLAAVGIGWVVALSGLGKVFGFTPLPSAALLAIAGIVGMYLVLVEFVKRSFYRRMASSELWRKF